MLSIPPVHTATIGNKIPYIERNSPLTILVMEIIFVLSFADVDTT
jgi:hypothetical protein